MPVAMEAVIFNIVVIPAVLPWMSRLGVVLVSTNGNKLVVGYPTTSFK